MVSDELRSAISDVVQSQIQPLKQEIQEIKAVMVTKDDIKNMATKDDLKSFATKDDIKNFATKDDLKNFATKDDLRNFATKDDIKDMATKSDVRKAIHESENLILGEVSRVHSIMLQRTDALAKDMQALREDMSEMKTQTAQMMTLILDRLDQIDARQNRNGKIIKIK